MDWLAVFVVCAIVVQLCLPLVGAYRNNRRQSMAKRRADLLEAAADRQASKISADWHTDASSQNHGAPRD
jgi:hypothetical protein